MNNTFWKKYIGELHENAGTGYAKPEIMTAARTQSCLPTFLPWWHSSHLISVLELLPQCHSVMTCNIWPQHTPPPYTNIQYKRCTHMWHTESIVGVSAAGRDRHVIRTVCVWFSVHVCVHACVRHIHSMTYARKIHVSTCWACMWMKHVHAYSLLCLRVLFSLRVRECVHAGLCVIVIQTGQLHSFVFSPEALLGCLAD